MSRVTSHNRELKLSMHTDEIGYYQVTYRGKLILAIGSGGISEGLDDIVEGLVRWVGEDQRGPAIRWLAAELTARGHDVAFA